MLSRVFAITAGVVSFCSLEGRYTDEELQQYLDDIKTKRSYQC